jgi:hypothetical protein
MISAIKDEFLEKLECKDPRELCSILLLLKVLMPWALGFFTYSSIKEHFTSIVGLEGNKSYNYQSLQLRNNGFWVWGGLATTNPSKISISQFWTMSTFHMAWALLTETMLFPENLNRAKSQQRWMPLQMELVLKTTLPARINDRHFSRTKKLWQIAIEALVEVKKIILI